LSKEEELPEAPLWDHVVELGVRKMDSATALEE
jgi:hypothetical protein